jgi:hypothetical protein
MGVVLIQDVDSCLPTVREKLIGSYAKVEHHKQGGAYIVSLINSPDDNMYKVSKVESVDKYPENFKPVVGIELSDKEIEDMVGRAYEHEGNMTVRAGDVVVIKFNGKVYVAKNPEVNDRV